MITNPNITSKYDVIKKIGQGGQGSVYLGINKQNNNNVAIKEMVIKPIGDENLQTAIKKSLVEIELLKNVSSEPNCNVYISCYIEHFVDWDNGVIYLVMEYIDGLSLKEYVQPLYVSGDSETLIDIVFKTVKGITEALNDVHSRGILHQDIKPENIVVENETGIPKLVDFGLACRAIDKMDDVCLSIYEKPVGECCIAGGGTFAYLAPERLLYNVRYPQSDIWSLGATMYTILTGRIIWGARDPATTKPSMIQTAVFLDEPEKIDSGNPLLDNLINGMTKKDITERLDKTEILDMLKLI